MHEVLLVFGARFVYYGDRRGWVEGWVRMNYNPEDWWNEWLMFER